MKTEDRLALFSGDFTAVMINIIMINRVTQGAFYNNIVIILMK